jgi:hypothetical protein
MNYALVTGVTAFSTRILYRKCQIPAGRRLRRSFQLVGVRDLRKDSHPGVSVDSATGSTCHAHAERSCGASADSEPCAV